MEQTINNGSCCCFVCCLATFNDENVIISAKFDKYPYFDCISSREPRFYFGLYVILLFTKSFGSEQRAFL